MSTSMLRACVIESSHRAHHFSRKTEYSKLWKLGISLCRCGMQGLVLKSQAPQVLDAGGGQVWLRSHRGEYLGIDETSPQPSTLVPGNPFLREEAIAPKPAKVRCSVPQCSQCSLGRELRTFIHVYPPTKHEWLNASRSLSFAAAPCLNSCGAYSLGIRALNVELCTQRCHLI